MNPLNFLILLSIKHLIDFKLLECKPQLTNGNIIRLIDDKNYFQSKNVDKPNLILISFDGKILI